MMTDRLATTLAELLNGGSEAVVDAFADEYGDNTPRASIDGSRLLLTFPEGQRFSLDVTALPPMRSTSNGSQLVRV